MGELVRYYLRLLCAARAFRASAGEENKARRAIANDDFVGLVTEMLGRPCAQIELSLLFHLARCSFDKDRWCCEGRLLDFAQHQLPELKDVRPCLTELAELGYVEEDGKRNWRLKIA